MSEELQELIELYVRGEASASQQAQVADLMEKDPSVLAAVYNEALFEQDLYEHFSKNSTEDLVHRVVKACGAPQTRSFRARQRKVQRKRVLNLIPLAVAATILVGISIVLQLAFYEEQPMLHVHTVVGADVYQINNQQFERVEQGQEIPANTRLWVGDTSEAKIRYADGTRIHCYPNTRLQFHVLNGSKLITVDNGHIYADVAKQKTDHQMVVRSQQAEIVVVGTQFDFHVEREESALSVSEGEVRFSNKLGDVLSVSEGQSALVSETGVVERIIQQEQYQAPSSAVMHISKNKEEKWYGKVVPGSDKHSFALAAVKRDGGQHHTLGSGSHWFKPMFKVHEDSIVRMRIKMNRKAFWHMFMILQKDTASSPTTLIELQPKTPRSYKPGEWLDLEFKIKDVLKYREDREEYDAYSCFKFFIDSQVEDIGLMLDSFEIIAPQDQ